MEAIEALARTMKEQQTNAEEAMKIVVTKMASVSRLQLLIYHAARHPPP